MNQETDIHTHIQEIQVIKKVLPDWATSNNENIKFQRLSGFTNITYRVIDLQGKRLSLIFKTFSVVEGMLERQYENRILIKGSEKGIGPKCYFADDKYRIEEDISGAVHPKNEDLQKQQVLERIIEKVSQFHKLRLEAIENMETFGDYILSEQYINQAMKSINKKKFSSDQQVVVDRITSYFQKQKLEQLRKKLLPKQKQMVKLCHNDLNNLNIMIKGEKTYLIDYEYSRYNYVAYDIANFISESSINYTKQTTPFFQFIDEMLPTRKFIEWVCETYLKYNSNEDHVDAQLVKKLSNDVERCFGLCNFYWAVWSPVTKNPQIFFDYMQHGLKRLERFEWVLNKINNVQE